MKIEVEYMNGIDDFWQKWKNFLAGNLYWFLSWKNISIGCGQSKKKAKHTAAKSMLDKLIALQQNQQSGNVTGIDSSVGVIAPPKASKVVELPKDLGWLYDILRI